MAPPDLPPDLPHDPPVRRGARAPGARIRIGAPRDGADLRAVRALFVEYAASLGFSLAHQGFDAELAELPGAYAPPLGALLLAFADDAPVGVVALRPLANGVAEMKRLFVQPAARSLRADGGVSLGRALAVAIVARARELGHRCVRLDTIAGRMDAAIALYRSLGFVEIEPYCASPVPGTIWFEKRW